MYYLNEGVYSAFKCVVFEHVEYHKPKTLKVSSLTVVAVGFTVGY